MDEISKKQLLNDINPQLHQAKASAELLGNALTKATTVNGTSLSRFTKEIERGGTNAKQMAEAFAAVGAKNNLDKLTTTIQTASRHTVTLNDNLKEMYRVLGQSIKFRAAMTIQDAVVGQAQEAIRWVQNLNQAMVDIQVVSGKSNQAMAQVFDTTIEKAKELHTTAKEYADAQLIYFQQGLDDDEVVRRSDITVKAARAAGEAAGDMSEQLTAVWNTYQMQGERLENAASIAAKIGAETAVDFAYISEAMQTSATAAAQMGVEYESLVAIIATVGETTMQSASVVGNAYKTIFSRFQQLKAEGTDGEVTLNRVTAQLEQLGIAALDANGDLRPLDDMIMELGTSWETYSSKQQLAIAELLGGTRQYPQMLALMNNFDKYLTNFQSGLGETGSETLDEQFATASESIAVYAKEAQEAWSEAFGQITSEGAQKNLLSLVKELGDATGQLIKTLGGLPGILGIIGAAFSKHILTSLKSAGTSLANTLNPARVTKQQTTALKGAQVAQQKSGDLGGAATTQVKMDNLGTADKLNKLMAQGNEIQKQRAQSMMEQLTRSQEAYALTARETQALQEQLGVIQQINASSNTPVSVGQSALIDASAALQQIVLKGKAATDEQVADLKQKLTTAFNALEPDKIKLSAAEMTKFKNETAHLKAAIDKLAPSIETADGKVITLGGQLSAVQNGFKAIQTAGKASMDKIEEEIDETTAKIAQLQDALADAESYQAGNAGESDYNIEGAMNALETGNVDPEAIRAQITETQGALDALQARYSTLQANTADPINMNFNASTDGVTEAEAALIGARNAGEGLNNMPIKLDVTSALSAVSQLTMGFMTLQNTVGSLVEEIASGEADIASIGGTLVSLIPTVLMLVNGISMLAPAFKTAMAGGGAAGKVLSIAGVQVTISWAAVLPILLAIVAVIAIVALAVTGVTAAIKAHNEAQNEQIAGASSVAASYQEQADAAKGYGARLQELIELQKQVAAGSKSLSEALSAQEEYMDSLGVGEADTGIEAEKKLDSRSTQAAERVDKSQDNARMVSNVSKGVGSAAAGATAGILLGAAMGSVLPVVGTAIGAVVGLIGGAIVGVVQSVAADNAETSKAEALAQTQQTLVDSRKDLKLAQDELVRKQTAVDGATNEGDRAAALLEYEDALKKVEEQELAVAAAQEETGKARKELIASLEAKSSLSEDERMQLSELKTIEAQTELLDQQREIRKEMLTLSAEDARYQELSRMAAANAAAQAALEAQNVKDQIDASNNTLDFSDKEGQNYDIYDRLNETNGGDDKVENLYAVDENGILFAQKLKDEYESLGVTMPENLQKAVDKAIELNDTINAGAIAAAAFGENGKLLGQDFENISGESFRDIEKAAAQIAVETGKELGEVQQYLSELEPSYGAALQQQAALTASIEDMGLTTEQTAAAQDALFQYGLEYARAYADSVKAGTTYLERRQAQLTMEAIAQQQSINATQEAINVLGDGKAAVEDQVDALEDLKNAGIDVPENFFAMSEAQKEAFLTGANLELQQQRIKQASTELRAANLAQANAQRELNEAQAAGDPEAIATAQQNLLAAQRDVSIATASLSAAQQELAVQFRESGGEVIELNKAFAEGQMDIATYKLLLSELVGDLDSCREALANISISDFSGTVEQQLGQLALFNEQLRALGLPGLTEDFLGLTDAEQEQTLALLQLTAAQNEYNKALEAGGEGSAAADITFKELAKSTAKAFDLDAGDLQSYAKHIQKVAKNSDMLSHSLETNQKAALKVATATLRADRGFENLNDVLADSKKAFKEADVGSARYKDALDDLRGPVEDILNVDPGTLSDTFLASEEALGLMEKALQGDMDALWGLQTMAASTYLADIVPEESLSQVQALEGALLDAIDAGWELGELDPTMDTSGFIAACEELIAASGMSVEQADAYFKQLGFDMDFNTETKTIPGGTQTIPATQEMTSVSYRYVTQDVLVDDRVVPKTLRVPQVKKWTVDSTETVTLPDTTETTFAMAADGSGKGAINSVTNTGSAGTKGGRAARAPSNRGGSGGGSGGGGGSSEPNKPVERKNYGERYRNTQDKLKVSNRSLERLNTVEQSAFGMNRVALIRRKNKELQQQGRLYNQLAKEAENYLKVDDKKVGFNFGERVLEGVMGDQDRLNQMLELIGANITATFDEFGAVNNMEEILAVLQEIYDVDYRQLAAALGGDKDSFDALKEVLDGTDETLTSIIEQVTLVGTTAETWQTAIEDGLANIQTWIQNKIDEVEYKIELRMSINARDIRLIQMTLDQLGSKQATQTVAGWGKQVNVMMDDITELTAGANRLQEVFTNLNSDNEIVSKQWFENNMGEGAWEIWKEGTGEIPAELMEAMLNNADQMLDWVDEMYAKNDAYWAIFRETLQLYLDEFDSLIGTFDTHQTMLDSWLSIWNFSGKQYQNAAVAMNILTTSIDNQQSKVESLQEKYGFLTSQVENAERVYQAALSSQGADSKHTQQTYQDWQELRMQALELEAEIDSGIVGMLDSITAASQKAAEDIRKVWNEELDGMFSDLASAMDMYSQKRSIDTFYMHENDLAFELSQMLRDMDKEMADVTDPALLSAYAEWIEKVNALKDSGVQMTEKELEILKAEFDLEKAQAQWEEQQAAKNSMRLARDASGNYSYVYSQDGKESDDSEADIEQKLHNIEKMHRDAADEAAEMWLQLNVELEDYIANIDYLRYQNDTKYRQEVDARLSFYNTQLDQHAGQVILHNDAIGRNFEDTTLGVIIDMDDMATANDMYKNNHEQMTIDLMENNKNYQEDARDRLNAVGVDYDKLEQRVQEETDQIKARNDETADSIDKLRTDAEVDLDALVGEIEVWAERWRTEIKSVIDSVLDLIQALQDLAHAQAGNAMMDQVNDFGAALEYSNQQTQKGENSQAAFDNAPVQRALENIQDEKVRKIISGLVSSGGYGYDENLGWAYWDAASHSRRKFGMEDYLNDMLKNGSVSDMSIYKYDTGGLATGPQIAALAQDGGKELVLNQEDTRNILEAVKITRGSVESELSAAAAHWLQRQAAVAKEVERHTEAIEQNVHITAEFPGVQTASEIEEALMNLDGLALQYVIKK